MRWLLAMWFLGATLGVPAHGSLSAELGGSQTPTIAAPNAGEHEPPTAFDEAPTASELSLVARAALPAPVLLSEGREWPGDDEHSSVIADIPTPPPIA